MNTQAQRFVIRDVIPYAAEVPGTDMGEQTGGVAYWQRTQSWTHRVQDAARYTLAGAEEEVKRLKERFPNAEVYDADLAAEAYKRGRQSVRPVLREISQCLDELVACGLDNSPVAVARMQELLQDALRD